jgi:hypothetical protein
MQQLLLFCLRVQFICYHCGYKIEPAVLLQYSSNTEQYCWIWPLFNPDVSIAEGKEAIIAYMFPHGVFFIIFCSSHVGRPSPCSDMKWEMPAHLSVTSDTWNNNRLYPQPPAVHARPGLYTGLEPMSVMSFHLPLDTGNYVAVVKCYCRPHQRRVRWKFRHVIRTNMYRYENLLQTNSNYCLL